MSHEWVILEDNAFKKASWLAKSGSRVTIKYLKHFPLSSII